MRHFIGIMAGTSLDGLDFALCQLNDGRWTVNKSHHVEYPDQLLHEILMLARSQSNNLELVASADRQWAEFTSTTLLEWATTEGIDLGQIEAIGSHGQTIRHAPQEWTVQIGDPNIMALNTGCTVVADFRRADIAAGGQGAPLVPIVHDQLFSDGRWACLNLGGIANVTLRDHSGVLIGFDTGPANTLSDQLAQSLLNLPYDANGDQARSGTIQTELLHALLSDDYFEKPAPKSTGPEKFSIQWWNTFDIQTLSAQDQLATAIELTAVSVCDQLTQHPHLDTLWVCGGGVHNRYLMDRIRHHSPIKAIQTTDTVGISTDAMEAFAFAVLAQRRLDKLPSNCPSVTGAKHEVLLGGIYESIR